MPNYDLFFLAILANIKNKHFLTKVIFVKINYLQSKLFYFIVLIDLNNFKIYSM